MTRTPELTGQENLAPSAEQRLWVREQDEHWTFWWRGAGPLMVLGAVLSYGLTAFAQKTESQIRLSVADQLNRHGLTWVQTRAEGQSVVLAGRPPTQQAQNEAVAVATQAKCQSWLGSLPCATTVLARFDMPTALPEGAEPGAVAREGSALRAVAKVTPGREFDSTTNAANPSAKSPDSATGGEAVAAVVTSPAATGLRWFDLNLVRTGSTLKLEGDVPNEQARTTLSDAARTHFPAGTVDNALRVVGGELSLEWEGAAKHAIEVAARCEQGVISLANASLRVDCETQTSAARDAITTLLAEQHPGLSAGTVSVLALDEVKACEEGLFKLVNRSQIRFTTNSAKLLPSSRPLLREISHQLEHCPGVIVVEGHTDAQGVREENVELSLNRARAVVSGLVGLGVPASRVRAEGFGPDHPLATNETATGRAQNRRIEFRVARTGIRGE